MRRSQIEKSGATSGQYMVEFGLTFGFFIMILLVSVNLIILGYNYNTIQRATWEAARAAAVGESNAEIANILYDEFVSKYLGTMLLVSKPIFDPGTYISPNDLTDRTEGTEVTIWMGYQAGISMGILGNIIDTFPVKTSLVVVAENDNDKDGINDEDGDLFPGDYRNLMANGDAVEPDWDQDGIANISDTAEVWNAGTIDAPNYTLRFHVPGGTYYDSRPGSLDSGTFMTRTITYHQLATVNDSIIRNAWPLQPVTIPLYYHSSNPKIILDLSKDRDNDGWMDKFDNFPDDPDRR